MVCKHDAPLVSAIIPTRNRPDLVLRAVRSVLAQTFERVEAVVVVDGHDPKTLAAMEGLCDPRVRIVDLEESVGGGEARNIGVAAAVGTWIALLDDDDEWLPGKVEAQVLLARQHPDDRVVVVSDFIARSQSGDIRKPTRPPCTGEPFSEYLFSPGCGYQTSTFFCTRRLFLELPFTSGLRGCQDLDWILRVMAHPEIKLQIAHEPLTIFHVPETRASVSRGIDWQFRLRWGRSQKKLMTARAYSLFVLTVCVTKATMQPFSSRAFFVLLRECLWAGQPNLRTVFYLLGLFLIPADLRRALKHFIVNPIATQSTVTSDRSVT